MSDKIIVLGSKGTGSDIAEAFLELTKIRFEHVELNYSDPKDLAHIQEFNVLGQVPTLVLPNGTILTETLAIATYANSFSTGIKLIPKENSSEYVKFWRWAVFIVAAIYPTFTYGDEPEKWINKDVSTQLRQSTDQWRQKLWLEVEKNCSAPYFLGKEFSAIDVYLKIMINWRPRIDWFKQNCPMIYAVATHEKIIA